MTEDVEEPKTVKTKYYKLPNLCDPEQGQLFPDFDKIEDWEEFEDIRKD